MNLQADNVLQGIHWSDVKRALPLAGGMLVLVGIARRSPWSVLLAAVGASMVYESVRNGALKESILSLGGTPSQQTLEYGQGIRIQESVTIRRSQEDLYRYWRDLENLPRVMRHLQDVRVTGILQSHWVVQAPAGTSVEWDAEIIRDKGNETIAWRSMEGADVPNAGSVRFEPAPGDAGTLVTVNLKYDPPLGALGAVMAKLFGADPSFTVNQDLHRFKSMMELNRPGYMIY